MCINSIAGQKGSTETSGHLWQHLKKSYYSMHITMQTCYYQSICDAKCMQKPSNAYQTFFIYAHTKTSSL